MRELSVLGWVGLFFTVASIAGCDGDGAATSPDLSVNTPILSTGGNCPAVTGAGTMHTGTISADETWTAAASPHFVTFDLAVKGATLTIEPCAVVRVKAGYGITIGSGNATDPTAKLVARGTVSGSDLHPVTFTVDDGAKYWGSLAINATGSADLEHVILKRAGNLGTAQNFGGALRIFGDDNRKKPVPSVRAVSVLIDDAATAGINIQRSGGFTADSKDVTVQGCGKAGNPVSPETQYALYVESPSLQTIPPGTYTGNFKDAILVPDPGLDGDETFHERGVPYRLKYSYGMKPSKSAAQGGLATLTIEAGVTIKLMPATSNIPSINLGTASAMDPASTWPVKLVAAGTVDKPITITSDAPSPMPGDWAGIEWGGGPSTGNVMTYVKFQYGGGPSLTENYGCGPTTNDAELIITGWRPDTAFIQNCSFLDSAAGGIVSGWFGDGPNLRANNTFTNIAKQCEVSQPTPLTGGCPSNRVTPDCY